MKICKTDETQPRQPKTFIGLVFLIIWTFSNDNNQIFNELEYPKGANHWKSTRYMDMKLLAFNSGCIEKHADRKGIQHYIRVEENTNLVEAKMELVCKGINLQRIELQSIMEISYW